MSDVQVRGAQSRKTITLTILDPTHSLVGLKNYELDAARVALFLWDNLPSGTFDLLLDDLNSRVQTSAQEIRDAIGQSRL